jgi:hypothetical protein
MVMNVSQCMVSEIFLYFSGGARNSLGTMALRKEEKLLKVKCRFQNTGILVLIIHRYIKRSATQVGIADGHIGPVAQPASYMMNTEVFSRTKAAGERSLSLTSIFMQTLRMVSYAGTAQHLYKTMQLGMPMTRT